MAVIKVEEVGVDGAEIPSTERRRQALCRSTLDLVVDLPGRVFVRGRGLESEWQGKLQVTGTASDPRLVGELRGQARLRRLPRPSPGAARGRDQLWRRDAARPDDRIEATANVTDLTVVVRIEGRALQPTLTLDSEPPLPQDEILARLLFERETSQMTPAQAAQLALAVNRLRGGGGFDVLGRARALLGVDTLDFARRRDDGSRAPCAPADISTTTSISRLSRGLPPRPAAPGSRSRSCPTSRSRPDTGANAQSGVGIQWRYDF